MALRYNDDMIRLVLIALLFVSCSSGEKGLSTLTSPKTRCAAAILVDRQGCDVDVALLTICPDGTQVRMIPLDAESDTTYIQP